MRSVMMFAFAAIVIGALVPKLYSAHTPATAATVNVAAVQEQQPAPGGRTAVINRASNGHYQTEAVVDGRHVEFMVDTGASVIALRERDAARLGIHPVARDYNVKVSTANGTVRAARVDLSRVDVGGVTVRDVAALVLPDEALGQNLLGMSFLSRLRWEQKNGKLILEQ
jgi:aspartyl protease family protein